jgi:hypothetical protein
MLIVKMLTLYETSKETSEEFCLRCVIDLSIMRLALQALHLFAKRSTKANNIRNRTNVEHALYSS